MVKVSHFGCIWPLSALVINDNASACWLCTPGIIPLIGGWKTTIIIGGNKKYEFSVVVTILIVKVSHLGSIWPLSAAVTDDKTLSSWSLYARDHPPNSCFLSYYYSRCKRHHEWSGVVTMVKVSHCRSSWLLVAVFMHSYSMIWLWPILTGYPRSSP